MDSAIQLLNTLAWTCNQISKAQTNYPSCWQFTCSFLGPYWLFPHNHLHAMNTSDVSILCEFHGKLNHRL